MAEPLHRQLLIQARRLARLDPRRPQQGNLRRAVSAAYYALFHFLIDEACRFLLGTGPGRARLRKTLARAFAHAEMANAAQSFAGGTLPRAIARRLGAVAIPHAVQELAEQFLAIQYQRHLADYDLSISFSRGDAIRLVEAIERAVANWLPIRTDPAAEFFLLSLLVWNRIRER
jgi:hypothetical protein